MYQTYHFAMWRGSASLSEYVASGKNVNGNIMLSFLHVDISGNALTQYVPTEHCHTVFFSTDCHTEYEPRGYTTDEVMAVQNGLLYNGYNSLNDEVNKLEKDISSFG